MLVLMRRWKDSVMYCYRVSIQSPHPIIFLKSVPVLHPITFEICGINFSVQHLSPVVLVDSSPPSNRPLEEPVCGGSVSLYSFWLLLICLQTFRCKSSLVLFLRRRRYSSLTLILFEFHCPVLDSMCYLNGLCFHFPHVQASLPSFCFSVLYCLGS